MYKFAVFYRRSFWFLIIAQIVVIMSMVFFYRNYEAPIFLFLVLALISLIHFFGLIAVIFDTHRCARNNSVYLKRLTEILDPKMAQDSEQTEESEEELTEELLEANKNLGSS